MPTPVLDQFICLGSLYSLLNFVGLYTLKYWLQDMVDMKSFHNVSNFAPDVKLPLALPNSVVFFKVCRFPMCAGVCGAIKNDLVYNNEGLTITPPWP